MAFAGLLGTAVVSVLGAGLDTEVMMALAAGDDGTVPDSHGVLLQQLDRHHPVGLGARRTRRPGHLRRSAGSTSCRAGSVASGWCMGGLALLLGISPLEYMAGPVAALWLVVTSVGFLVGDRAHRSAGA